MTLLLCLGLAVSPAHALVKKESFSDLDFASKVFTTVPDRQSLEALKAKYKPAWDEAKNTYSSAYIGYGKKSALTKWLEANPQSDAAKYQDVIRVDGKWHSMYGYYVRGLGLGYDWRKTAMTGMPQDNMVCRFMMNHNFFTDNCDLPDWRTPEMIEKEKRRKARTAELQAAADERAKPKPPKPKSDAQKRLEARLKKYNVGGTSDGDAAPAKPKTFYQKRLEALGMTDSGKSDSDAAPAKPKTFYQKRLEALGMTESGASDSNE